MNNNAKLMKPLIFFLLIFGLVFIIFIGGLYYSRSGKTPVEFVVVPSDATVFLNDKTINPGVIYMSPGEYSILVEREHFEGYEGNIMINTDPQIIPVGLNPLDEEGYLILESDSEALFRFEGEIGEIDRQRGIEFKEYNPITSYLPFVNGLFLIDYRLKEGSDMEIVLIITVHEQEKEYPHDQLREWGYLLEDFEIEYRNWQ